MAAIGVMTIKAARERLAVSRTTFYALINSGLLERVYRKAPPRDGQPGKDMPRITVASIEAYERGEAQPRSIRVMQHQPVKRVAPRKPGLVHFR